MLQALVDDRNATLLAARRDLAALRLERGYPAEVVDELRHCREVLSGQLGPEHWEVALATHVLGRCLVALDRRDEAVACLDESLPLLVRSDATPAAVQREALEQSVQIYESWDQPEQAARYRSVLENRSQD